MRPELDLHRFYELFEAARLREHARLSELDRQAVDPFVGDPFRLGALRTLISGLPRRAAGLSQPARMLLAERLRDAADAIENSGMD